MTSWFCGHHLSLDNFHFQPTDYLLQPIDVNLYDEKHFLSDENKLRAYHVVDSFLSYVRVGMQTSYNWDFLKLIADNFSDENPY